MARRTASGHLTRLRLQSWKNFLSVDVALQPRTFLIGANASGKSNLLDAVWFLHEIAEPQGGLRRAVDDRGGVKQIRCLHARRDQAKYVAVEVEAELDGISWSYRLEFNQDRRRVPRVHRERVARDGEILLERPTEEDDEDPDRLTQTHLEQINENKGFRPLASFLAEVRYLHLVPQLLRGQGASQASDVMGLRPFGSDFLEQLADTQTQKRNSRLRRINDALRVAVPRLKELTLARDERTGRPHLWGRYEHWRRNAGWQSEAQLSDGTLRLIGLLWSLMDGRAPILLEEPELSLHVGVVEQLPQLIHRVRRDQGRQVLVSTHSADLLNDEGIDPSEVLLVEPAGEDSRVRPASEDDTIRALAEDGVTVGSAAFPRTKPSNAIQLGLRGLR